MNGTHFSRRSFRTIAILTGLAIVLVLAVTLLGVYISIEPYLANVHLCDAVKRGDTQSVERYLADGARVDSHCNASSRSIEEDWTTLLHQAVGHPDMMELLLRHGVDVNARNSFGETALWDVVRMSDGPMELRCAKLLIEAGIDVNAQDYEYGMSAVHKAASSDSVDCLRLLLENGGDPNLKKRNGDTPMHIAGTLTKRRRNQTVQILLEYGADPSIVNNAGRRAEEPLPVFRDSQPNSQ